MKRKYLFSFLAALALGGAAFMDRPTVDTPHASASLGLINAVVDADNPPIIVNVLSGGTITIVKKGGAQNVSVFAIPTDGKGFLFLQFPGSTKVRTTRRGSGIIQIRQPGRGVKTITVFVH